MRVVSLASGSRGNACLVEEGGLAVLIDCGLGPRTLERRMAALGESKIEIVAVMITHSHSDHTSGLEAFASKRPDVPVFANVMTAETIVHECGVPEDAFACFENGQVFDAGPFSVKAFSIPHDTSDPVGFVLKTHADGLGEGATYFHCTDIGSPVESVGRELSCADIATIESNHDPVMLKTSGRAQSLIRRIYGPRGHLSNDEACELVSRFASPKLKTVALAHLSGECNAPHLAENAMRETLLGLGRCDVAVKVLSQERPVEIA